MEHQMDHQERQRLLDGRNEIARAMADLRDEHAALGQKFAEFAETCTSHSADRAAEQVAAEMLVERLEKACAGEAIDGDAVDEAIRDYKAELTRIEGL